MRLQYVVPLIPFGLADLGPPNTNDSRLSNKRLSKLKSHVRNNKTLCYAVSVSVVLLNLRL